MFTKELKWLGAFPFKFSSSLFNSRLPWKNNMRNSHSTPGSSEQVSLTLERHSDLAECPRNCPLEDSTVLEATGETPPGAPKTRKPLPTPVTLTRKPGPQDWNLRIHWIHRRLYCPAIGGYPLLASLETKLTKLDGAIGAHSSKAIG